VRNIRYLVIINEFQVQVDRRWSVSTTPWFKIFSSGTDVTYRSIFLRYPFSIYLLLLIVRVPNFLNLWDHKVGSSSRLWYQFSLYFPIMNSLLYPFWGMVYHTVTSLCIFGVFICRWCIIFKGINTKNFIFLVSLWFLSPSTIICNLLCLSTKVLNPVASP